MSEYTSPPPFNPPRPLPSSSMLSQKKRGHKPEGGVKFALPPDAPDEPIEAHFRPHRRGFSPSPQAHKAGRILHSLPNFRDVGGQRTVDGQAVRHGIIYRGASVDKIHPDDVPSFIDRLGMKTLIDLRHKPFSGQLGLLAPYYRIVKSALQGSQSTTALSHHHSSASITSPSSSSSSSSSSSTLAVRSSMQKPLSSSFSSPHPLSTPSSNPPPPNSPSSGSPSTNCSSTETHLLPPTALRTYSASFIPPQPQASWGGVCYPIQLTGLRFYLRFVSQVPARTWCEVLSDVFCCRVGRTKARISGSVLTPMGLEGLYRMFLEASKREILSVLRLYARRENYPIVVYCNHGKDRTGIIVALVLSICRVDLESIVLNYSESHVHLADWHEEIRNDFASTGVDPNEFATTPQEVMRQTILYINASYGSVQNYLEHIGLSHHEQEMIREILLESPSDQLDEQDHLPIVVGARRATAHEPELSDGDEEADNLPLLE